MKPTNITRHARRGEPTRRAVLATLAAGAAASFAVPVHAAADNRADPIVALAALRHAAGLFRAGLHRLARSLDGGKTWQEIALRLLHGASIQSLAVSAGPSPSVYVCAAGAGILRGTADGGGWHTVSRGPLRNVTAVATHARQDATVYAYAPSRGIYRSDDAGVHWRLMDAGPRGGITRFVHSDMPGSMQTGWLFATGPQGVRLSMDCFCGWRATGELPSSANAIACDPRRPARVVVTAGVGVFESTDGAQTWSKLPAPGAPVAALAIGNDGTVYAGVGSRLLRRTATGWDALDA